MAIKIIRKPVKEEPKPIIRNKKKQKPGVHGGYCEKHNQGHDVPECPICYGESLKTPECHDKRWDEKCTIQKKL